MGEIIIEDNKFKKIIKVIGRIFTLVSIVFIAKRLLDLEIKNNLSELGINSIVIIFLFSAVVSASFGVVLTSINYNFALTFFTKKKIDLLTSSEIYIKPNIYKYLPGNIMHFIGRNAFGASLGMSQKHLTLSNIVEIGISLATPLAWVFLLSFNEFKQILKENIDPRVVLIVCIAIVLMFFAVMISKKFKEWVNLRQFFTVEFLITALKMFLVNSFSFFLQGLLVVLIFKTIYKVSFTFTDSLFIISSTMLSWCMGFITPGAPGGVGVKEKILLQLLKNVYSKESTIVVVLLLHRVILIMSDVISLIIFTIYRNMKTTENTISPEIISITDKKSI